MDTTDLDPNLTKQHLKAMIFRSYIIYVNKFYPSIDVAKLSLEAGLPIEYLMDENKWVSVLFEERFIELLKSKIKDPEFLTKVGRFGVKKDVTERIWYFTRVLSLKTLYGGIAKYTGFFNKVVKVEILQREKNRLKIQITPVFDNLNSVERKILVRRFPDFIQNTVGYYSCLPSAKNLGEAKIRPEVDLNESSLKAVLDIELPAENNYGNGIRFISPLLLAGISLVSVYYAAPSLNLGFAGIVSSILGLIVYAGIVRHRLAQVLASASQTEETLAHLDIQYKVLHETQSVLGRKLTETKALNEVVAQLLTAKSEDEILKATCNALINTMHYDRAIIMLAGKDHSKLSYGCSLGLTDDLETKLKNFELDINIDSKDPRKIANVLRLQKGILIEDVDSHLGALDDQQSKMLLTLSGSKSFIAVPVCSRESTFGILMADCVRYQKVMDSQDFSVLTTVGYQLAISLEKEREKKKAIEALENSKRLAESYSRFVPWETLKLLNYRSVFDVHLGDGIEKKMTILFSDIRDFTKLCSTMNPRDTLLFLNSYFGTLSPIIRKNEGIIDKFIGDCIMAIFPTPKNAIKAGVEIQRAIIKYNIEHRIGGRTLINAKIGIAQGPIVFGSLGFDGRIELTALSDTVNIASRLDGLCKDLNAKILCAGIEATEVDPALKVEIIEHETPIRGKIGNMKVTEIIDKHLNDMLTLDQKNKKIA